MINEYNRLRPLISNWVHNERISEDRVHLSASSIVRKEFTKNRICNLITKYNLNLDVLEDDTMEYSDRFFIQKK